MLKEILMTTTNICEGYPTMTKRTICCCVNCICVPVCRHKHHNDLVHNCEIITDELKTLSLDMMGESDSFDVFISHLDKSLVLQKGKDFLFISSSPSEPYHTLIPTGGGFVS